MNDETKAVRDALALAIADHVAARQRVESLRLELERLEHLERFPCGPARSTERRADAYSAIDWVRGDQTGHGTV